MSAARFNCLFHALHPFELDGHVSMSVERRVIANGGSKSYPRRKERMH
jgi:hypothetical protein